ncbi:hypothetical protein P12x_001775 [Tundrisphaera lichenicola]|uniref:hypothetical protein n=1 Tax=Tundrisphaera lichenicola TaxID=2029860 RepID=UPI003EB749B7
MPYSRLIPMLVVGLLVPLVAWSQDPAPATQANSSTLANNVLTETIIKLRLREKIAASIEQTVDMLNQKFSLEGNYYKDTGHRVRLQLNLKGLGETGSLMAQVCDGKVLWDYQKVLGMQSYRRRDITQILKRLEDPALDDLFRNLITTQLGFGGPEAMLTGLQKAIEFDQFADEKVEGVETYILGGTWKDRSGLLGANDRPLPPTASLPPYIPKNVRVFIRKDDLWPYRIEMIGQAPLLLQENVKQIDPATGRTIGVSKAPPKVDPSKVVLNYKLLDVAEVKPELFDFTAPADASSTNLVDDTEQFLGQLDQYIQTIAAQKKAEAAKAEGELLFKAAPLDAPSPSIDSPAPK